MRVLICPDKFKGSLTARQAARAIERGVHRALPRADVELLPLADGGEGSMELLGKAYGLRKRKLTVAGPLRRPVEAAYYLGAGRAVIETASACGMQHVPAPRRNPENTTTVGVGTLLDDALARGATEITLLLGGSATNDAGAGMAAALGFRFFTAEGYEIVPMAGTLGRIARIDVRDRHPGLAGATITALCDVDNPLLGTEGATYTYAPQKGAAVPRLPELEASMRTFSEIMARDLGRSVTDVPGGGAAGGLGAGAVAFLGADLRMGAATILEALDFQKAARRADLVFTGEGSLDRQTARGKVVSEVIASGRPTVVVCGHAAVSAKDIGAKAVISLDIYPELPLTEKFTRAAELIEEQVFRYCRDHGPAFK
ncbi:glycerate kinase [Lewinella sp. IMCC34191]|uniref:glycerate kinase family protein n=1 Tax=Lewinella sp. IMCC34191 TaxID=2259172 RepID=UPI0013009AFF|nr:glycerate kinase [Lewinella sp. IMCC34191]